MTNEEKVPPRCPTCATQMRPAGPDAYYVCEECGATVPSTTEGINDEDAWLRAHYEPTEEEKQQWEKDELPSHVDIVAGFLMSNNLIFGVPNKAELFRLDHLRKQSETRFSSPEVSFYKDALRLHYVKSSPLPFVLHTLATPPLGVAMGGIVEVNYNVRLQAILCRMVLTNIRILHGSPTDDSPQVVFEGAEFPGAAANREVRVVRVTVHNEEFATWETVSETTYPRTIY